MCNSTWLGISHTNAASGANLRPLALTRSVALAIAALIPMLAACNSNTGLAPRGTAGLQVAFAGRVERGGTLQLHVTRDGAQLPDDGITWAVSPVAAAQVGPSGQMQLSDIGLVSITAHTSAGVASLQLQVVAPPTIVFDMHDVDGSGTLGNRDIYRVALDGRDLSRLTSGTGDNAQPTAVHGSVVFTSYRDGYPALYRVAVSGGAEARLPGLAGTAYQAAMSPDGSRLAFIAPDSGADKLWIAAADGSGAVRANKTAGTSAAEEAAPAWSPNGDDLAFVSTALGDAALVALDVPQGTSQPYTDGTTTNVDPSWSPDGRSLVFSSNRDGDLAIFVMALASGTVTRISPQPSLAGEPSWLPDGRIIFTNWTVSGGAVTSQLAWADPAVPNVVHPITTPAGSPEHAKVAK
jgi:Tol biopolymer transport system component